MGKQIIIFMDPLIPWIRNWHGPLASPWIRHICTEVYQYCNYVAYGFKVQIFMLTLMFLVGLSTTPQLPEVQILLKLIFGLIIIRSNLQWLCSYKVK